MTANRNRSSRGVDIQLLAKRLREHLDAIDAEMADALHVLDEIEAVSEALPEPVAAPEPPRASRP